MGLRGAGESSQGARVNEISHQKKWAAHFPDKAQEFIQRLERNDPLQVVAIV